VWINNGDILRNVLTGKVNKKYSLGRPKTR
jgi:hypothetical protein